MTQAEWWTTIAALTVIAAVIELTIVWMDVRVMQRFAARVQADAHLVARLAVLTAEYQARQGAIREQLGGPPAGYLVMERPPWGSENERVLVWMEETLPLLRRYLSASSEQERAIVAARLRELMDARPE